MLLTGAEILVKCLLSEGVDTIFGYPGGAVLNIYDYLYKYKDKIKFSSFHGVWRGYCWKHIMPEVFTKENKEYYMHHATDGENSDKATLTNEEVIICRERYVNETAKEIYKDFQDRMSYQTFQQMLWGRTYKNLPIYKKKSKEWIGK